jgi:hypothetical protein
MRSPEPSQVSIETSPSKNFDTPEKLLADMSVEPDKKVSLLQQWASDLEDRLRAADENMPSSQPGITGDLLRRVKSAQLQLHAE